MTAELYTPSRELGPQRASHRHGFRSFKNVVSSRHGACWPIECHDKPLPVENAVPFRDFSTLVLDFRGLRTGKK
eukprot:scaffold1717_cov117-Cylindrotheca_fusiformis.AAC.4